VASKISIAEFDALVADVMRRAPYRTARRVFWIVDNGTIHRGARAIQRLRARWPNLVLVHLPIHASWLNQIEIYFSIVQRKALTPDDFVTPEDVRERLLGFQRHYQRIARPFEWRFTRADLVRLLRRCSAPAQLPKAA
jgi:hypothetical protein